MALVASLLVWGCGEDGEGEPVGAAGEAGAPSSPDAGGSGGSGGDGGRASNAGEGGAAVAGAAGAPNDCRTAPLSDWCDQYDCPAHIDDMPTTYCNNPTQFDELETIHRSTTSCDTAWVFFGSGWWGARLYFDEQGKLVAATEGNDTGGCVVYGELPCALVGRYPDASALVCSNDPSSDELSCDQFCEDVLNGAGGAGGQGGAGSEGGGAP